MTVSIDRDLAKDLIDSKIEQLDFKIEEILQRWSISSISEFLERTKSGDMVEAVPDAISLRNLVDKRKTLTDKLDEEDLK